MDDETARAALEVFGKGRGQNRGGRARQHGVGRRGRIEPREHRALHLDILRRVLLDVDRSFKRRLECCRLADPCRDFAGRSPVQKIVGLKLRQEPLDIRPSLARRLLVLIPDSDFATRAGETDRPGAADEACADHRHFWHVTLQARVSLSVTTSRHWRPRRSIGRKRYAPPATEGMRLSPRRRSRSPFDASRPARDRSFPSPRS